MARLKPDTPDIARTYDTLSGDIPPGQTRTPPLRVSVCPDVWSGKDERGIELVGQACELTAESAAFTRTLQSLAATSRSARNGYPCVMHTSAVRVPSFCTRFAFCSRTNSLASPGSARDNKTAGEMPANQSLPAQKDRWRVGVGEKSEPPVDIELVIVFRGPFRKVRSGPLKNSEAA